METGWSKNIAGVKKLEIRRQGRSKIVLVLKKSTRTANSLLYMTSGKSCEKVFWDISFTETMFA